jgi:hypothetical protein
MRKPGKNISDISFQDLISYFRNERYKIKKYPKDMISLPEEIFSETEPIFVFSTGRAGSQLLSRLFDASKLGSVYHEPYPIMDYGSKLAFELGDNNIQAKKLAFLNARYDLIKKAFLEDKRYVETNNRVTFFMDALIAIFPKAKFIHLIRHPGSFVRSGIRRNYYQGHDNDTIFEEWKQFDRIQKNAWLWTMTNQKIENLKQGMNSESILTIKAENLFSNPNTYQGICEFINHSPLDSAKIEAIIKKPANVQKQNDFPKWMDWSAEDKQTLIKMTPLGEKYKYWKASV